MSISCQQEITINVKGLPNATAYWKYEEVGNVTRVDSILGLATEVLTGSVPNTAGVIGQAAFMANAFPFPLLMGDIFNPSGGTAWSAIPYNAISGASISVWLKYGGISNVGNPFNFTITFQDLGGQIQEGFLIRGDNAGLNPTFSVDLLKHFGAVDATIDLANVPLGSFHNIVVTYNQATHIARAYLDGVFIGQAAVATWIAAAAGSVVIENPRYFDTTVDELAIWTGTVLTDAQAAQAFNGGAGLRPPNVP